MAVRLLRLTRVAPCSGTTCGPAASLVLTRGTEVRYGGSPATSYTCCALQWHDVRH
jgi:hypothetical protein